jgi:hypothetical protein
VEDVEMASFPQVLINQKQITPAPSGIIESLMPTLIVGTASQIVDYNDNTSISYFGEYGSLDRKTSQFEGTDHKGSPYPLDTVVVENKVAGIDQGNILVFETLKLYAYSDIRIVILVTTASASSSQVVTLANTTDMSKIKVGDHLVVDNSGAGVSRYTIVAINASNHEITVDAPISVSGTVRIERKLTSAEQVDFNYIYQSSDDVNTIKVYAGLKNKDGYYISYAKLYNSFTAIQTGVFNIDYIDQLSEIEEKIGKINENNQLALGVYVAKSAAPSKRIYFLKVSVTATYDSDKGKWDIDIVPNLDAIAADKTVYRVVPLFQDLFVLSQFKSEAEISALPENAVYRMVYGSMPVPVYSELVNGDSETDTSSTASSSYNGFTLSSALHLTGEDILGAEDRAYMGLPAKGDKIKIVSITSTNPHPELLNRVFEIEYTYYVIDSNVKKLSKFRIKEFLSQAYTDISDMKVDVIAPDGTIKYSSLDLGEVTIDNSIGYYFQFIDTSVDFLSAGVAEGDYLVIDTPIVGLNPSNIFNHTIKSTQDSITLKIKEVTSNSIRIDVYDNPIRDLPNITFKDGTAITGFTYTIKRKNSSGQMVTILNDMVNSVSSKRLKIIMAETDTVNIPSLNIKNVPSMYLACAVAAYRDALPIHQGFTHLGIPVVSLPAYPKYFSYIDKKYISSNGIDLYVQDSPVSQPYSLHQLTTAKGYFYDEETSDVETLDQICRDIKRILDPFIGVYNITMFTLNQIRIAITNVLSQYRDIKYPRIGSAIVKFSDPVVQKSQISGKVTASVEVALHDPLNVIDLTVGY